MVATAEEEHGQLRAAVSNAIVGVYTDYMDGPTKAKTFVFDDYILCVLEGLLTTAERTSSSRARRINQVRLTFQQNEADKFTSAVAELPWAAR